MDISKQITATIQASMARLDVEQLEDVADDLGGGREAADGVAPEVDLAPLDPGVGVGGGASDLDAVPSL